MCNVRVMQAYRQLRGGYDILRDCWLDKDSQDATKPVLVVRQLKFDEHGELKQDVRLSRFTVEEMQILSDVINVALRG